MAKFQIKDNPLIPYTYHLNEVSFNKDRNIKALRWKIVSCKTYKAKMIAHLPPKSISHL